LATPFIHQYQLVIPANRSLSDVHFFHFKIVRLEVGIGLKVMISFFRNVKACRLIMNVKSVL